eukprot:4055912-Amphidinium_carterae.1
MLSKSIRANKVQELQDEMKLVGKGRQRPSHNVFPNTVRVYFPSVFTVLRWTLTISDTRNSNPGSLHPPPCPYNHVTGA